MSLRKGTMPMGLLPRQSRKKGGKWFGNLPLFLNICSSHVYISMYIYIYTYTLLFCFLILSLQHSGADASYFIVSHISSGVCSILGVPSVVLHGVCSIPEVTPLIWHVCNILGLKSPINVRWLSVATLWVWIFQALAGAGRARWSQQWCFVVVGLVSRVLSSVGGDGVVPKLQAQSGLRSRKAKNMCKLS